MINNRNMWDKGIGAPAAAIASGGYQTPSYNQPQQAQPKANSTGFNNGAMGNTNYPKQPAQPAQPAPQQQPQANQGGYQSSGGTGASTSAQWTLPANQPNQPNQQPQSYSNPYRASTEEIINSKPPNGVVYKDGRWWTREELDAEYRNRIAQSNQRNMGFIMNNPGRMF